MSIDEGGNITILCAMKSNRIYASVTKNFHALKSIQTEICRPQYHPKLNNTISLLKHLPSWEYC
jgi:hypothetical protein